ncbi:class I SAM-dependent methyltransferase [Tolumonas lignilytica]|uniref:class I SAM-dependent methyltransferase n=1 Tax=Tolumonas lignilytica TaxID=1283284 RepID=UPI0004634AB7|nr:class I SAM-dependent methyltransferase [Tolumonas lignilytica]
MPVLKPTISFYSARAVELSNQYERVDFEAVHHDWLAFIPTEGMVLDVGAGSGRDARYLASKGLSVVAVEPAEELLALAKQNAVGLNIHWVNDALPELREVFRLQTKFDLILLSAVWMHIPASERQRVFRKLSSLLKPNGKIVLSLRHGPSPDSRVMYPVSSSELAAFATQYGLHFKVLSSEKRSDQLGRNDVSWETILLILPDDSTGAFPLIRNIVVNDAKASTYKLALLRALLRIAEGHPGAVTFQNDTVIELPLGLVALYWLKLYKPLIDRPDRMQQSSNSGKGLGFIKPMGWERLAEVANNDFYIGACYLDANIAQAVHQTLKDISKTIKEMPAKYITLPGTDQTVFEVETKRISIPKNNIILDSEYFQSFGSMNVPKQIWDSLVRYSVWIEPALVNEWSSLMAGYTLNRQQAFTKTDYLNALNWEDPQRCTTRVRDRVHQLQRNSEVNCCWSGKSLQNQQFAIDHAFPFARWPNNDLWNLLPSKTSLNLQKSDRLPTSGKLQQSRSFIVTWWQQAWRDNENEFFTQAAFALPGIQKSQQNFNDVFDAMTMQRDRIKDLQQLSDWC